MQHSQKGTIIFNIDGSLTSEAVKACKVMKIDPQSLIHVSEEDLKKQGVADNIAKIRVKHMTEKRMNRIFMLENCIRNGTVN